jgi:hypothetical protein
VTELTNAQMYLAVGLPTVAILVSLLLNLFQFSGIRGEISVFRGELSDIRADLREKRADIKLLTGKGYEMMGQRPQLGGPGLAFETPFIIPPVPACRGSN